PGRRPRLRLRGSRRPRLRPRRARGRPRRPPPPFRFGRPPDADHPHPDRPGRRWRRPLVDGSPRPVLARLTRSGRTRPEARAISPHPPRPSGSAPRSRTVPRSLSVDQVPGRPAASTARARRLRLRFSLRPRLRLSATGRTTGAALLGAALVAGSLAGALPRAAAAVDATPLGTWTTNGDVNSVFAAGGRIYLGGDFDQVGPDTGSGVPLDAATGARPAVFPQVNGPVFAAVPDGSGGWYIGGLFTRVGDKSRQNAARILADGTVGGWNPNTDSTVRAIAVSKAPGANVAWIGGDFTVLNKASTPVAAGGLAATNANTGAAIWGLPSSSGGVAALALSADGSRLIAGGYFTIFGGAARSHIAAVDPATGALQPSFSAGADDAVRALAAAPDGRVFAGGDFTRIGGGGSAHLAALTGTGSADPAWQTAADGRVDGLALSADGSRLYAAGAFGQIGGTARDRLAALSTAGGGAVDPAWNPAAGGALPGGEVLAAALSPDGARLYAGGGDDNESPSLHGAPRRLLVALDASTGAVDPGFNPRPAAAVETVAASAGAVFAGGQFTSVNGAPRANLAALDAATGVLDQGFVADTDGPVDAVVSDGTAVYAGGVFNAVDGVTRHRLVRLDAATGAVASGWQ